MNCLNCVAERTLHADTWTISTCEVQHFLYDAVSNEHIHVNVLLLLLLLPLHGRSAAYIRVTLNVTRTHTSTHSHSHTTEKKSVLKKRAVNSCFNSVNDESVRFPYYNRIQFTNWFKINSSSAREWSKEKNVWRIAMHKIIILLQSILVNKICPMLSVSFYCFVIQCSLHIGVTVTV